MAKYVMTWGESECVREAFSDTQCHISPMIIDCGELTHMSYTEHQGMPELVGLTKQVIKRQTGLNYKYVAITNGAIGAIYTALRVYRLKGFEAVATIAPPYFSIYPTIIRNAGFNIHRYLSHKDNVYNTVLLIDSPSNPRGNAINEKDLIVSNPIIWDSVYHNNVYTDGKTTPLESEMLVGSYSKLLGINGIRLGWIATNNEFLSDRIEEALIAQYCGVSRPSQELLIRYLREMEWNDFENSARESLNRNRSEWSKLERYFEGEPTSKYGMFYYGPIDKHCKILMEKSDIEWTTGSKLGTDDNYGRFNIGLNCAKIYDIVKTVLKTDGVK